MILQCQSREQQDVWQSGFSSPAKHGVWKAHATLTHIPFAEQVGTLNVEIAAQYVLAQAMEIADLATSHPHLLAVVDREQATGGFNAHFAGVNIASAYQNLTNIMLYISPRSISQTQQPRALLLNSHFDSVFGTRGGIISLADIINLRILTPLNFNSLGQSDSSGGSGSDRNDVQSLWLWAESLPGYHPSCDVNPRKAIQLPRFSREIAWPVWPAG